MTTPLPHEPRTGDGLVPYMSTLVDRLWDRLPEVYRSFDAADTTWTFKRYLGGVLHYGGTIDTTITAMAGDRPVGPTTPEPWGLPPDELARWRAARLTRPSALGDPDQADAAWLPWLAQLVGARLDPAATEAERRDTIRYATSGWRGGTRGAIEDAARSALTGGKYVRVVPHSVPSENGGVEPGTVWDITIVTRTAETPDPAAVLGAVLRKGVKPAGAVLWHTPYQANWDQIEAILPTWEDWEAAGSWTAIEEAGLSYTPVPDNLVPNPSFEVDTTGWEPRGVISTIGRVAGGVDGLGMLRVTTTSPGTGEVLSPVIPVAPDTDYVVGFSMQTTVTRHVEFSVDWFDGVGGFISFTGVVVGDLDPGAWQRGQAVLTSPPAAATARFYIHVADMTSDEWWDLDAVIFRQE